MSLLLFILVFQSCKTTKRARRLVQRPRNKKEQGDKSSKKQYNENNEQYEDNAHFYHQIDAVYTDRDQCKWVKSVPICSNKSQDFKTLSLPLKIENRFCSFGTESLEMNGPTSGPHTLPSTSTAETCLTSTGSTYYIDPVFVCEDQQLNNTANTYSYIQFKCLILVESLQKSYCNYSLKIVCILSSMIHILTFPYTMYYRIYSHKVVKSVGQVLTY